jgi:hypothetical protein
MAAIRPNGSRDRAAQTSGGAGRHGCGLEVFRELQIVACKALTGQALG